MDIALPGRIFLYLIQPRLAKTFSQSFYDVRQSLIERLIAVATAIFLRIEVDHKHRTSKNYSSASDKKMRVAFKFPSVRFSSLQLLLLLFRGVVFTLLSD